MNSKIVINLLRTNRTVIIYQLYVINTIKIRDVT